MSDATFSRQVASAAGADATVTLYYDTDTNPAGRVLLAPATCPAIAGQLLWDVTALPPGTYYVYATVTDAAGNSQSRFSTGPLRVRGGLHAAHRQRPRRHGRRLGSALRPVARRPATTTATA